jgi:hypothetical protein
MFQVTAPEWLRWAALACGVVLVVGTALGVGKVLVVPRRVRTKLALMDHAIRRGFLFVADRIEDYDAKDRVLAYQGPATVLMLLVVWMVTFWVGYALILWPLIDASLFMAFRESGSSMLTLGIASSERAGPTFVNFLAAATGLVVIALLIGYLPTIYAAFNRRERLVTMLQSRAGVPAYGPEILWRHQLGGRIDALPDLYADWEQWAADVAESHTNYPVLIHFRSPHPLRSWIVGLTAVMDSAAMYLALCPDSAPTQARLCLRMGFVCLREIADAIGIPYDPDPYPDDPIELTYEEFLAGVARMQGFPIERPPEEAWPHFVGWRTNYEAIAYAVADWVAAPPGPWTGPRRHLPGMAFVPQRPANRIATDPAAKDQPKIDTSEWRSRG